MNKQILILLSVISMQLSSFAATVPVIITAGQSNTDGRVPSADMPSYLSAYAGTGMSKVVWSYGNSGGWSLTGGQGVFAPYYPMCESANDRNRWAYDAVVYYNIGQKMSAEKLYVIKHSAGGTSIAPESTSSGNRHWSVDQAYLDTAGSKAMSPALVSNIRACLATIAANGDVADIRCILWHQGESDRTPTASANAYHDNLQAVVNYLRDSLVAITGNSAYAHVPFICGTVSKKSALYSNTIEKAQYRLATEMEQFYVIDMQDGTMLSDMKHFDAASAELFGKRMYNKICQLGLLSAYGVDAEDALAGVEDAEAGVDFGDEVVVTDTTEWVFTSYAHNAPITDSLMCMDGLYLRGYTGSHAITAKSVNSTIAAYVQASPSFVSDISTAGMAVTSANDRSVALNIAYPGKVTVVARSNSSSTDEAVQAREMVLWFNGDTAAHKSLAEIAAGSRSYIVTLTLEAQTAGVVYLTCENAFYVFSVKYEPQPEMEGGDDIIGDEPEPEEPEQPQQKKGKRLHMCGDSMMSTYLMDEESNPEQFMGWGQVMQDYLDSLPVTNWAHTGRTAKGFYTGKRMILGQVVSEKSFWQCVMDSIHAGDYVILSFGHNDQKSSNGYLTWRTSEYGTSSEYDVYMGLMISEATAKGAQVIIASSICRNLWNGNELTTLAQIDGSEAQGYTTEGSNHDFDFPYGAQYIANQYGLPFINLTAETKKLLEGYGGKSGASIFYGNGGTTHTSELGARAVAMIADSILLELGLMSDYIKADEIDIPWYSGGEFSEVIVADSTVWVFSGYEAASVIDSLHEQNGLYLRGAATSNHGFTVSNTNNAYKNQTFSNGAAVSCSQYLSTSAVTPSLSGLTAGAAVTNSDDRCAAVNTSCPGTFYALYYMTKSSDGRYVALSFDGETIASIPTADIANRVVELTYHADKGGTFVMWSNIAWSLLAAQFVPDADTSEDDWHEPSVPTSTKNGVCNSQAQKKIENGQVIIVRDNRKYDILGRIVQN